MCCRMQRRGGHRLFGHFADERIRDLEPSDDGCLRGSNRRANGRDVRPKPHPDGNGDHHADSVGWIASAKFADPACDYDACFDADSGADTACDFHADTACDFHADSACDFHADSACGFHADSGADTACDFYANFGADRYGDRKQRRHALSAISADDTALESLLHHVAGIRHASDVERGRIRAASPSVGRHAALRQFEIVGSGRDRRLHHVRRQLYERSHDQNPR